MDTFESVVTELIEGLRSGEIVLDRHSQIQKSGSLSQLQSYL